MSVLQEAANTLKTVGELVAFLWNRKLWWLVPVVVVLLALGLLTTFASASGLGPFLYTLF